MFWKLVLYLKSTIQSHIGLRLLSLLLSVLLVAGFEVYSLFDNTYKLQYTYKYSEKWGNSMDNTVTDWFHDSKYGLFVHYLFSSEADFASFNAEAFAAAVNETGAKYAVMTLGQNSGYFCSPN